MARFEHPFEEILGKSSVFLSLMREVEIVAPTDSTVLIQGETGTGKELIARAIHNLSSRSNGPFIKMNCSAIPASLLESELFGHEKGAFTGAVAQRIGRFEMAHNGTIFLDEIGDTPLELQPKLLRVLQEQEFERLGSSKTLRANVRVVAATNRALETMIEENQFRSDLYYRLNIFPLVVPALRERLEDIPLLAQYFVNQNSQRLKKRIEIIPEEILQAFIRYAWPGNIRELQNTIERAVILSQGNVLSVSSDELKLPLKITEPATKTLEQVEREHIMQVLEFTNWVIGGLNGAAARLGLKRTTLHGRMEKLGIRRRKLRVNSVIWRRM